MEVITLRQEVIKDVLIANSVSERDLIMFPEDYLYNLAEQYLKASGINIEDVIFNRAIKESL